MSTMTAATTSNAAAHAPSFARLPTLRGAYQSGHPGRVALLRERPHALPTLGGGEESDRHRAQVGELIGDRATIAGARSRSFVAASAAGAPRTSEPT